MTRHYSTAWLAERGDPQGGSRAPRQLLTQASANVLSSREGTDGISLFVAPSQLLSRSRDHHAAET